MSLSDKVIKQIAVDKDRFKNIIKDLKEREDNRQEITTDDELISKIKVDIRKNLNELSDNLNQFFLDLMNPDFLNYYKNEEELNEASERVRENNSKTNNKEITKNVDVYSEQSPLPGFREYFPHWQTKNTKDIKEFNSKISLEDNIKNEFRLINDRIDFIIRNIKNLEDLKVHEKDIDLDVTYDISKFDKFNDILKELNDIKSDISNMESYTAKGVTLIQNSSNLIDKILNSDNLRDFFSKIIQLKSFIRTQMLSKNFKADVDNVIFNDNKSDGSGEQEGELSSHKQKSHEIYTDKAIAILKQIENFFKIYLPYLEKDSSFFKSILLNDDFNSIVKELDYVYDMYKDHKDFPNTQITDGMISNFLVNDFGLNLKTDDPNFQSSSIEEKNFIKNLINFVVDTLKKVNKLKENISKVFRSNKKQNNGEEQFDVKFEYDNYVSYLQNIMLYENIDVNIFYNLFNGVVSDEIADLLVNNLKNIRREEYDKVLSQDKSVDLKKGLKLGLFYVLLNSVKMIDYNLKSIKTGKYSKDLSNLLNNYMTNQIPRDNLRKLYNIIYLIYSNIRKASAPVLIAKSDFNDLFKDINIIVNDNITNYKDTFDTAKIGNIVESISNISKEAENILVSLNDIKSMYLKPLSKDSKVGEITYNSETFPLQETILMFSNIISKTKDDDKIFEDYYQLLANSISKFKKI